MTDKLIFEVSVDGLVKSVQPDLTPHLIEQLKLAGLDVTKRLDPAYPAEVWAQCVTLLAEALHGSVGPTEGARRVAQRTLEAFASSMMGTAVFGVLKLIGPDRTVARLTRTLRTGSNFIEAASKQLGSGHYEITINDVSGVPGFYQGLIEAGMRHSGTSSAEVTVERSTGVGAVFTVRWT